MGASLDVVGRDADIVGIRHGLFGALAVEADEVAEGELQDQKAENEGFHLNIIIEKNRNPSLNPYRT